MGALRAVIVVSTGAILLCGLYSGLDIKYGDKGYYCWSAFCLLVAVLGGGPWLGTAAVALLSGAKVGGLEPFAVLLVSAVVSKILHANMFTRSKDDLEATVPCCNPDARKQVARKPYEEEIREILFQNDPSRLHLVDGELRQYKGRERQLLREYEAEFAPALMGPGAGTSAYPRQKSVKEQAVEDEQRRVQATLDASLQRIMSRKANRR
ncbi:unnamed protein product [Scytosiphon promiscuus]